MEGVVGIAVLAQQLAVEELGRKLTVTEFKTLLSLTGVTIVDGDGEPLGATVMFADQSLDATGDLSLRGLPTGPLRLFVSAPDHRTAIVDTVVTSSPRTIRLVLPAP